MITFKKIRFKNFGSFGNNFTEINLEKDKTTLVFGKNGSGKSFAMLDSLTFALFGKPFRKINIPQLQNSVNQKESIVELFFTISSDSYKIRRGLAPKVFEIFKNDQLINQDAKASDYQNILEQQILRMNYKTFTQVVILGSSSFVPFMQLSAADRRTVIENILDIDVFASMNTLIKGKISEAKESIKDTEYSIQLNKNKIESQNKLIKLAESTVGIDINSKNERLKKLEAEEENLNSLFNEYINKEKERAILTKSLNASLSTIEKNIYETTFRSKQLNEEKKFYETEESCPRCKGTITKENKEKNIKEIKKSLQNLKENLSDYTEEKEKIQKEIDLNKPETVDYLGQLSVIQFEIKSITKEIKRYQEVQTAVEQHLSDLNTLTQELEQQEKTKISKVEELQYLNYAYDMLKDSGVKSKIIRHYLPSMNKFINKYLSSMNFFIKFSLDEEFNEEIKSRYRDEFSYMNFSEGEKMRIDLALLLAWREVARLKNSVHCNLLILDEVFDSSLDSIGTDDVIRLLNTFGTDANVFVISHKADQIADKFNHTMSFEKKGNFSKLLK
jgi:DNA repair exonuclease SbcCD ATPase subunit